MARRRRPRPHRLPLRHRGVLGRRRVSVWKVDAAGGQRAGREARRAPRGALRAAGRGGLLPPLSGLQPRHAQRPEPRVSAGCAERRGARRTVPRPSQAHPARQELAKSARKIRRKAQGGKGRLRQQRARVGRARRVHRAQAQAP